MLFNFHFVLQSYYFTLNLQRGVENKMLVKKEESTTGCSASPIRLPIELMVILDQIGACKKNNNIHFKCIYVQVWK